MKSVLRLIHRDPGCTISLHLISLDSSGPNECCCILMLNDLWVSWHWRDTIIHSCFYGVIFWSLSFSCRFSSSLPLSPAPIRAHSRSLPLSLLHVLMHEYLRENDRSHFFIASNIALQAIESSVVLHTYKSYTIIVEKDF